LAAAPLYDDTDLRDPLAQRGCVRQLLLVDSGESGPVVALALAPAAAALTPSATPCAIFSVLPVAEW
jgi:hypothetical protein